MSLTQERNNPESLPETKPNKPIPQHLKEKDDLLPPPVELTHSTLSSKQLFQTNHQTQSQTLQIQKPEDQNHQEEHVTTGEYLKSGVYGGLDGLINTLSIILGGIAAGADTNHILLIAVAGIISDGISMGLGDYLSSKSQIQYVKAQRERETWEAEHKLDDELKQMEELYVQKGYNIQDSKRLGKLISKNPKAFVNIMMLQQLGLTNEQGNPEMNGIVNFLCFIIFGFLPVLPLWINKFAHFNDLHIMIGCVIIGGSFLFFLGLLKAWFIGTNPLKSGIITLLLGACAIGAGYGIGVAVG